MPSDTNKLTPRLVGEFRSIVGPEGCLDQPEDLRCYSYDLYARGFPELVLLPSDPDQVCRILALADRHRIPVTPRGAGSSLTGGPVPLCGGISLSMARMNQILEINVVDRLGRVQPGVVTQDFQKAVAARGLFYPPDPASSPFCTLGGNVATNAGGPRGVKYGVTRDYLLGLTLVLPGGRVLTTGGRSMKNVTGYDFTHFICGSEGQLGVISEITFKLLPHPECVHTVLVLYQNLADAVGSVMQILGAGIIPSTLELMDDHFLKAVDRIYGLDFPAEIGAALLIEVDGPERTVIDQTAAIVRLVQANGARDVRRAETSKDREKLWEARRFGTAALVRQARFLVTLDFSVPISRIHEAVTTIHSVARQQDLEVVIIGHAGDGNLHPMFIYDPTDDTQAAAFKAAEATLCEAMIRISGTLTGEHGVGIEKAAYLSLEKSSLEIELSRQVKQVFDPNLIMNPGKCEWAQTQKITPAFRIT
jgi:glycolate oxidase